MELKIESWEICGSRPHQNSNDDDEHNRRDFQFEGMHVGASMHIGRSNEVKFTLLKPPQHSAKAATAWHRWRKATTCSRTASSCSVRVRRNRSCHTCRLRRCSGWHPCGSSVDVCDLISLSLILNCSRRGTGIIARIHRPFTRANGPAQNPLHSF